MCFRGGGSAEYGQSLYFDHFFWDPSLSNFAVFNKPVIVDLEFKINVRIFGHLRFDVYLCVNYGCNFFVQLYGESS